MQYKEYLPNSLFSHHIECFWSLTLHPNDFVGKLEVLSPDCTYDIIFSSEFLSFKSIYDTRWAKIPTGAAFIGQKTRSINYKVTKAVTVFGIRFKPFAFSKFSPIPLYKLNDKAIQVNKIFDIKKLSQTLISQILVTKDIQIKIRLAEKLILQLSQEKLSIDTVLRKQTNYILDRKGILKINEMYTEFDINKACLRNQFIKKIGLSPKKISSIWRLNYFLLLQKQAISANYTQLGLDAGFYDQAHFIKEFRTFFDQSPLPFFKKEHHLLKISQESIAKRFLNVYDPV